MNTAWRIWKHCFNKNKLSFMNWMPKCWVRRTSLTTVLYHLLFLTEQSGASVGRFGFCNVSRAFSGYLAPRLSRATLLEYVQKSGLALSCLDLPAWRQIYRKLVSVTVSQMPTLKFWNDFEMMTCGLKNFFPLAKTSFHRYERLRFW